MLVVIGVLLVTGLWETLLLKVQPAITGFTPAL